MVKYRETLNAANVIFPRNEMLVNLSGKIRPGSLNSHSVAELLTPSRQKSEDNKINE